MGKRADILRSFVRQAADRAGARFGPLRAAARSLRELVMSAGLVSDEALTRAVGRAPNVTQASVVCRDGRIWVEACQGADQWLRVSFAPEGARFAPRGPKELLFHVAPPELADKAAVRDLAAALAAAVAHALWAPLLGLQDDPVFDAIAERDGQRVRVDLRSVPAVRAAMQRGVAPLFDALELGELSVADGGLRLRIKLPALLGA